MSLNTDLEEMLTDIKSILEATHTAIAGMADGERVQIKDLAETVGSVVSKSPKEVFDFVNHFAHNTKIAYVSRGKNGGIIKGVKVAKVVKKAKKPAVDPSATVV